MRRFSSCWRCLLLHARSIVGLRKSLSKLLSSGVTRRVVSERHGGRRTTIAMAVASSDDLTNAHKWWGWPGAISPGAVKLAVLGIERSADSPSMPKVRRGRTPGRVGVHVSTALGWV